MSRAGQHQALLWRRLGSSYPPCPPCSWRLRSSQVLPAPALRPRAARPCLSSAHKPLLPLLPPVLLLSAVGPSTRKVRLTPSYECVLWEGTALKRGVIARL